LIGVPFPDGRQKCYAEGDVDDLPADLVPRLARKGWVERLEERDA